MEQLDIKTQIIVIRKAKFYLVQDINYCKKNNCKITVCGLCYYLRKAITNSNIYIKGYGMEGYKYLKGYIPLFTSINAVTYANADEKYNHYDDFWWDTSNYKDRLYFSEWMLEELQKQLK